MRPRLDPQRRTFARLLATLFATLWPVAALAGPPQLPSSSGADRVAQTTLALADTEGAIPVQRPASMDAPRALSIGPASAGTPALSPGPAEIGPQPPPASPVVARSTMAGPADPLPAGPALDEPEPKAVVLAEAEPPREPFAHRGVVADLRVGTLGCIGAFCRQGHDVTPGVRVGGFLGGNVRGWFEAGLGGGWGTLSSNVAPGTNALLLYGLDPGTLQQALLAQAAGLLQVDLAGLAVQDTELRAAQLGPSLRIHLIPRGRVGAFVGSGVGYNVLRTRYQTAAGAVGLDFHGIEVPVEANLSVYLLEHLAVGLQFDYMWTWYGVAVLDHPQQRMAIPLGVLQAAGEQQGVDLRGQLPQLWTLGLAVRGRL